MSSKNTYSIESIGHLLSIAVSTPAAYVCIKLCIHSNQKHKFRRSSKHITYYVTSSAYSESVTMHWMTPPPLLLGCTVSDYT